MDKSVKIDNEKRRLLDSLVKNEILRDKRLYKAFLEVPLENFIPEKFIPYAKLYDDVPNVFYYDESNPRSYRTISAPHMITIMLQGLALGPSDDLLILGAKSGYISALAHKLAPKGEIIILEANSDIAKVTTENLKRLELDNSITVIVKNPLHGMPELSPWQKILVTGAIKQSKIHPLLKQLDPNDGVLYAPIGEEFVQFYTQILRMNEEFFGKRQLQVRFTPLVTQLELNELELITDFDESELLDEQSKIDQPERIKVKYATKIFENVRLQPEAEIKPIDIKQRDNVISHLEEMEENVKNLKKEGDIEKSFSYVEEIESNLEILTSYKKIFDLKLKKIQNMLNRIQSYNIMRKELKNNDIDDSTIIDKKVEILNKQIEEINSLDETLKDEIQRIKSL